MRSIFVSLSCGAVLLAIALSTSARATAAGSLLEAIRRNDVAAVKAMIGDGTDASMPDETGATPLMYAALYAGPEMLAAMLDRGAPVNAANAAGATALMWAATSPGNVRLLIERGADLNARTPGGLTPIVVAARFGNADAVRLMLAAGADTKTPATRTALLTAAYVSPTTALRDALKQSSIVMQSAADFRGPVLGRNLGDLPTLNALLDLGVDAKETLPLITFNLPMFFIAAREGSVDAMKVLAERGADPTAKAGRGWTALMLAAADDAPNTAAMRFLIEAGVDINATDDEGRTALDWALTRGETEASAFLRTAGGLSVVSNHPLPSPVSTPRSAKQAIGRAITRLQPAARAFAEGTNCSSCHNQNLIGIAVARAEERAIAVDKTMADQSRTFTSGYWQKRREAALLGDAGAGFLANAMYTLFEMAEEGRPQTPLSDMLVIGLSARQGDDGAWSGGSDIRPPLANTPVSSTAFSVRALRQYAPDGRRAEMEDRVVKGMAYLRQSSPRDTQEHSFKLLGLVWTDAPATDIADARVALIALQRRDGGWAQLPSMSPDAYATGQALYALQTAKMAAADPVYTKGVDFLLKTQLEDGTWFVPTRAFGFQPYFETGFPHGRSQFISTAATAWAAIALAHALDDPQTPRASAGQDSKVAAR